MRPSNFDTLYKTLSEEINFSRPEYTKVLWEGSLKGPLHVYFISENKYFEE